MARVIHGIHGHNIVCDSRKKRNGANKFPFLKNNKVDFDKNCIFCQKQLPSDELISRWPKEGQWNALRLRNIFPILDKTNSSVENTHELICPTPNHADTFGTITLENTYQYFKILSTALEDSAKKKNVIYTSIFTNDGAGAGASQQHLHTQLLGIDILPERILEIEQKSRNRCYYCSYPNENKELIIDEQNNFVALCPEDSHVHFQIKILGPHKKGLYMFDEKELLDLSILFSRAYQSLESCTGNPSVNILYRNGPHYDSDFHFHIDILPRLTVLGGFEYDTGIMVLSSSPYSWAEQLRAANFIWKI
jgi:UDPglucose--hexose-1-phosphate uridylyltransferase